MKVGWTKAMSTHVHDGLGCIQIGSICVYRSQGRQRSLTLIFETMLSTSNIMWIHSTPDSINISKLEHEISDAKNKAYIITRISWLHMKR